MLNIIALLKIPIIIDQSNYISQLGLLWTPEAFPGPNLRFPRKAQGAGLSSADFAGLHDLDLRFGRLLDY